MCVAQSIVKSISTDFDIDTSLALNIITDHCPELTKKQLHTMNGFDCVVKKKRVPFGPLPWPTGFQSGDDAEFIKYIKVSSCCEHHEAKMDVLFFFSSARTTLHCSSFMDGVSIFSQVVTVAQISEKCLLIWCCLWSHMLCSFFLNSDAVCVTFSPTASKIRFDRSITFS